MLRSNVDMMSRYSAAARRSGGYFRPFAVLTGSTRIVTPEIMVTRTARYRDAIPSTSHVETRIVGDLDTAVFNWIIYTRVRSIDAANTFAEQLIGSLHRLLHVYYRAHLSDMMKNVPEMSNASADQRLTDDERLINNGFDGRDRFRTGVYRYVIDAMVYNSSRQVWINLSVYAAHEVLHSHAMRRMFYNRSTLLIKRITGGHSIVTTQLGAVKTAGRALKRARNVTYTRHKCYAKIESVGESTYNRRNNKTEEVRIKKPRMSDFEVLDFLKTDRTSDQGANLCLVPRAYTCRWTERYPPESYDSSSDCSFDEYGEVRCRNAEDDSSSDDEFNDTVTMKLAQSEQNPNSENIDVDYGDVLDVLNNDDDCVIDETESDNCEDDNESEDNESNDSINNNNDDDGNNDDNESGDGDNNNDGNIGNSNIGDGNNNNDDANNGGNNSGNDSDVVPNSPNAMEGSRISINTSRRREITETHFATNGFECNNADQPPSYDEVIAEMSTTCSGINGAPRNSESNGESEMRAKIERIEKTIRNVVMKKKRELRESMEEFAMWKFLSDKRIATTNATNRPLEFDASSGIYDGSCCSTSDSSDRNCPRQRC